MEKNKIFKQNSCDPTILKPKKINTHLLYKRLTLLRTNKVSDRSKQTLTEESMNMHESARIEPSRTSFFDEEFKNTRISNKIQKEDETYSSFKQQNVKKMELWEKFQEVKEKMSVSSHFLKNNKEFLARLVIGSEVPKKLLRDFGKYCIKTPNSSIKKAANSNKFSLNSMRDSVKTFTGYKKVQAFSSIKQDGRPETNSEALKYLKFYSESQKTTDEYKHFRERITTFEGFTQGKEERKEESSLTNRKFKKSINNIFISTFCSDKERGKRGSSRSREIESFDFFNVSSKNIYSKII